MAEKIVQIDHVTKKYKERTVLDDVSLSIWTRDVIGLLGGNGAGKTTLMRAIAGSIPVDSGEISFLGERRTQDVGTLIENPNIYTDMSGIENLRYFGRLFGVEDEPAAPDGACRSRKEIGWQVFTWNETETWHSGCNAR